jgi:hypothetical protein
MGESSSKQWVNGGEFDLRGDPVALSISSWWWDPPTLSRLRPWPGPLPAGASSRTPRRQICQRGPERPQELGELGKVKTGDPVRRSSRRSREQTLGGDAQLQIAAPDSFLVRAPGGMKTANNRKGAFSLHLWELGLEGEFRYSPRVGAQVGGCWSAFSCSRPLLFELGLK